VGELATPVRGWRVLAERVRIEAEEASLGELLREVEAAGGRILAVQPIRRSLEDYFIEHVGAEEEPRWAAGD
jgi:hypothetical protein